MKEFLSLSVIVMVLMSACSKHDAAPSTVPQITNIFGAKINDVVVDVNGRKYRKLTEERLTNGVGKVDIWERIDPPNSNNWYTPTLSSKILGNTIEFNSLYRGVDEKP